MMTHAHDDRLAELARYVDRTYSWLAHEVADCRDNADNIIDDRWQYVIFDRRELDRMLAEFQRASETLVAIAGPVTPPPRQRPRLELVE